MLCGLCTGDGIGFSAALAGHVVVFLPLNMCAGCFENIYSRGAGGVQTGCLYLSALVLFSPGTLKLPATPAIPNDTNV